MDRKINIGIIWANPYNKNMGVAALAYSSICLIQDILSNKNILAEISFIGSFKNTTENLKINDKVIKFHNIYGLDFLNWKTLIRLSAFPKKFNTLKILNLDIIFDIGEGDSFTDLYGITRFKKILNSKKFFEFLGKKQILFPQTIGPFINPANEKKAFAIMQKMKIIISRDSQSYKYATKYLPTEKVIETIDIAFYLPFKKMTFNNDLINVGINISGLLWNGGYTQNNQFGLKADYKELMVKIIEFFSCMNNIQIHLISHVIPSFNEAKFEIEDDYIISETLLSKYPSLVIAQRFDNPITAKCYISGMDFFIGARMHSCIAAFSSGVPVFPIAYSRKFNGLFVETLKYPWIGDCVTDTHEFIMNNLKKAFAERNVLKEHIQKVNGTIVIERINLLKKIVSGCLKND